MDEEIAESNAEQSARWRAEEAARYLEWVRGMCRRMVSTQAGIDGIYAAAMGVHGIDYSRNRVAAAPKGDAIPAAVAEVEGALAELAELRQAYGAEISHAERALSRMPNQAYAAVLEMHYIGCRPWRACAEALGYSPKSMVRVRQRALASFYPVMPAIKVERIPAAI